MWAAKTSCQPSFGKTGNCAYHCCILCKCSRPKSLFHLTSSGKLALLPSCVGDAVIPVLVLVKMIVQNIFKFRAVAVSKNAWLCCLKTVWSEVMFEVKIDLLSPCSFLCYSTVNNKSWPLGSKCDTHESQIRSILKQIYEQPIYCNCKTFPI